MYVRVSVIPKAKREHFEEIGSGSFSASVKEPAERNLANRRVVQLVAGHFGVSPVNVRVVSGHRSPRKILDVDTDAV